MFPLIRHSRKGKIVGTENRLGVARAWRVGKTLTTRRHKELFWSDEYFLYLDVMRVTRLHAFFKIHITIHLKRVNFTIINYTFINLTLKKD